jgi:hypothetical protein
MARAKKIAWQILLQDTVLSGHAMYSMVQKKPAGGSRYILARRTTLKNKFYTQVLDTSAIYESVFELNSLYNKNKKIMHSQVSRLFLWACLTFLDSIFISFIFHLWPCLYFF